MSGKKMSISFKTSSKMSSMKHNNRKLSEKEFEMPAHKHIVRERSCDNIYIKQENLHEVYNKLFDTALEKYNKKQSRPSRRITDFYNHVKKSKTLDLQREFIVAVGTKDDWDSLSYSDKQKMGSLLKEYVADFEKRHKDTMYVYNAVVHLDEVGSPHLHLNVVPIGKGYKRGLEIKPSFKKALQNEGFTSQSRHLLREFRDSEVEILSNTLKKELEIDRKLVGTNSIKDMHQYKEFIAKIDELKIENDYLDRKNKGLKQDVQKAIQTVKLIEEYKLSEEPKKTLFGDKITIKQQDFYKLQDCYKDFNKLSLKLEQTEKAFKQAQQNHESEIKELKSTHISVVKDLKQAFKQEKATLNKEHSKQLENATLPFKTDLNNAKVVNDLQAEKILELSQENTELKTENNTLKKENTVLSSVKTKLESEVYVLQTKLQTVKSMFKDFVHTIAEENKLSVNTIKNFVQKQKESFVNRFDYSVSEEYAEYKNIVEDTFSDKETVNLFTENNCLDMNVEEILDELEETEEYERY